MPESESNTGATPSFGAPQIPSREIAEILLSCVPCAVAMVDREMRYVAVSPAWVRDYSLGPIDVVGRSHYEVFPDLPDRWRILHRRALAGESLSQHGDSFVRSDGHTEWVDWQLKPWHLASGEIGGILIITEVTTQKHAVFRALRDNESVLRTLFEAASIGMAVVSIEGTWMRINQALCRMLGYSAHELLATHFLTITHPEDRQGGIDIMRSFSLESPPAEFKAEKRYLRKDGNIVWAVVSGAAVVGEDGRPRYFVVQVVDITERKLAELRLMESELRIRSITDNIPVAISLYDMNDVVRFANAEFRRIGINQDPPEGQSARAFLPASVNALAAPCRARARAGERATCIVKPVVDGRERVRELTCIPARNTQGDIHGVYGIGYDITEMQRAFEQISALAQRLEQVREFERRDLSKRLHDGVAQSLFAMSLTLQLLDKESQGRVGVMEAYKELKESLNRCMGELRQVANDLRPAALTHLGIGTALKEHADYFSRLSGLAINLSADDLCELGETERLLLFRATQEALTNIAKHAHAQKVDIFLRTEESELVLTIVDDGVGIDSDSLRKPTSLGLLGLGEQFRSLLGSFEISKNPKVGSRGTVLRASLPLQRR